MSFACLASGFSFFSRRDSGEYCEPAMISASSYVSWTQQTCWVARQIHIPCPERGKWSRQYRLKHLPLSVLEQQESCDSAPSGSVDHPAPMSPAAIFDKPNEGENFNDHRDGLALEATSDAVDEVNVMKAALRVQNGTATEEEVHLYAKSQFDADKDKTEFRRYEDACDRVKSFYREQHEKQTVAYNLKARNDFRSRTRAEMTIWQAMEKLNTLIDESDPDTSLSQIEHLLQSAEAIRRDGKPPWFQLTGLIHDLGKLLFFYSAQGQWDVVGDTFPVGCRFDDDSIIYPDTFAANSDTRDPIYCTHDGIYTPGCGLDNVMLSWGHDEYLYHICKDQSTLPDEALAMIRYHSFYPWHSAGGYRWLMNDKDTAMLAAVQAFNPYDLYSKSDDIPKVQDLKEYYIGLINTYFPPGEGETEKVIRW
nr:inositol oxygenase 1 [Quercus suber]